MDPINKAQIPVPGIYRITRDTKNPRVNRRVSIDFNRIEIWKAGTRIGIRVERIWTDDDITPPMYRTLLWKLGQYDSYGFNLEVYPKTDPKDAARVNAILDPGVLELEPRSLESELTIRGHRDYHTTLLQKLVNSGKLTIEDVIEALEKKA